MLKTFWKGAVHLVSLALGLHSHARQELHLINIHKHLLGNSASGFSHNKFPYCLPNLLNLAKERSTSVMLPKERI
jgi:hypothetical protein